MQLSKEQWQEDNLLENDSHITCTFTITYELPIA